VGIAFHSHPELSVQTPCSLPLMTLPTTVYDISWMEGLENVPHVVEGLPIKFNHSSEKKIISRTAK
jgi:hypothetical protein